MQWVLEPVGQTGQYLHTTSRWQRRLMTTQHAPGLLLEIVSNLKIRNLCACFCDNHPKPLLLSACLQHVFKESGRWISEDWKGPTWWRRQVWELEASCFFHQQLKNDQGKKRNISGTSLPISRCHFERILQRMGKVECSVLFPSPLAP